MCSSKFFTTKCINALLTVNTKHTNGGKYMNKNCKTFNNLAKAFVGESCARNRYDMLAKLAEKEGYKCMADQIKLVATNEFNHARMIFSFINALDDNIIKNIDICAGYPFKQRIGSLELNLKLSAEDENMEASQIYPEFAKVASDEGYDDIASFFENLIQVETCHKKLFTEMHDQLKNGTLYKKPNPVKWKCQSCGYEHESKEAWQKCPLCQAPQGYVMLKINDEN